MKRKMCLWFFMLLIPLLSLSVTGQEVLIDEDFSADPAGLWQLNGSSLWDAANERIIITPATNSQAGSVFFTEVMEINNFRLEATAKLCCGSGADGMAITFIEDPEGLQTGAIGFGGGGMCATRLTNGPQIVVEFDIWGNDLTACEMCGDEDMGTGAAGNHIGVEYNPTGFQGGGVGDCIPEAANAHNAACAGTGKIGFDLYGDYEFEIIVQLQEATVTVDIGSQELGIASRRVITHTFQDYEPILGIMGITASTGGANAEQSITSLKLTSLPAGTCLNPAGVMSRTISPDGVTDLQWEEIEAWEAGSPVEVELSLTELREASENCDVPTQLTVEETLPAGWTAESISDGGTFADGKVTWTLSGAAVTVGKNLAYQAIPGGDNVIVTFTGTFWETQLNPPLVVSIEGEATVHPVDDIGFDEAGFIKRWLLLGPFLQREDVVAAATGANPGEDIMALDYLTDGDTSELTVLPEAGDDVIPGYNLASASSGLGPVTAINSMANPIQDGMTATWAPWLDLDDTISFDNTADDMDPLVFHEVWGTVDQAMCYAIVYITNETAEPIYGAFGASSDDGLQMILNGASIFIHNVPRGAGAQHFVADVIPAILMPGVNRVMIKVFEGGGGFDLRCRFQDAIGNPITENLTLSLEPPTGGCVIPPVELTRQFEITSFFLVEGVQVNGYVAGDSVDVSIELANVREAGDCPAAGDVTIIEYIPQGWVATHISNGGILSGNKITWTISAASLAGISELTYTTQGPITGPTMGFAGAMDESGNPMSFSVGGDSTFMTDIGINDNGFIQKWLILGPLMYIGGAAPPQSEMRRDYLTDGDLDEFSVIPRAGQEIETDFGGLAASTGLAFPNNAAINPNFKPMWYRWYDNNEWVDFQSAGIYGMDIDNVMSYAVCYMEVFNEMEIAFGTASDDSIQLLVGEGEEEDLEEVTCVSAARGWGGGGPQEVSEPQTFAPGIYRLMVKVFEIGGGWNFGVCLRDADDNPITSGVKITLTPPGVCVPLRATRTITAPSTISIEGQEIPAYKAGDALTVSLAISQVREDDGTCGDVDDITITETLAAGWTAANISDGGSADGNIITWNIPAAEVAEGTLTYEASGPADDASIGFSGLIVEAGNPDAFTVEGMSSITTGMGLSSEGFIQKWLILGPYTYDAMLDPANNPAELQRDFLTNADDITEMDVMPEPGDDVATDYLEAASTGLAVTANPDINPEDIPTWIPWHDANEWVDLQNAALYGAIDNVLAYAVCYMTVEEEMDIAFGTGSDDGMQLIVGEDEVAIVAVPRGWGGGAVLETSAAMTYDPGTYRIMMKVIEIGGAWNFGVQLLDGVGVPITEGITISLSPDGEPTGISVNTGDVNGDGAINLADAISLLTHLFVTKGLPCLKSADANDDGKLDLADAISILTYQFQNGTLLAPDGTVLNSQSVGCMEYPEAEVNDLTCDNPCN